MNKRFSKILIIGGTSVLFCAVPDVFFLTRSAFAQYSYYGAIATDNNGHWGSSIDYPSQAQAEAAALQKCGKSDCESRIWFSNQCGAVAENAARWGTGFGDSREEAQAQAISSCGLGDCRIIAWACTTR
jgi:hypothetical protein